MVCIRCADYLCRQLLSCWNVNHHQSSLFLPIITISEVEGSNGEVAYVSRSQLSTRWLFYRGCFSNIVSPATRCGSDDLYTIAPSTALLSRAKARSIDSATFSFNNLLPKKVVQKKVIHSAIEMVSATSFCILYNLNCYAETLISDCHRHILSCSRDVINAARPRTRRRSLALL